MISTIIFGINHKSQFSSSNTSNLSYVSGTVLNVVDQSIDIDKNNVKIGTQQLEVKINEGKHKNSIVNIKNSVTYEHNIYVVKNSKVIVCVDQPKEGYFIATLFNYNRELPIALLALIMVITLILVAGTKGVKSAFAIVFTFEILGFLLIPLISIGVNPILASIITIIPIVVVSMTSISGINKRTFIAIISTLIGVLLATIIFFLVGSILHINGYNLDEVDQLMPISQTTNLKINHLLFVGVLISSLGAMMDICISIVSSINELKETNHNLTTNQLFVSGMAIGKDIIGTMTNTLILAFTGCFFITLFLYYSYNVNIPQLVNTNGISIEIAQSLSGAIALILCMPITAYFASRK